MENSTFFFFFLNWTLTLRGKSKKNYRYKQARYLNTTEETENFYNLCFASNQSFVTGK